MTPLASPCTCDTVTQVAQQIGWQGTLTYSYDDTFTDTTYDPNGYQVQLHHQASVQVRFDHTAPSLGSIYGPTTGLIGVYMLDSSQVGGTASVHDVYSFPAPQNTTTLDASGTPNPTNIAADTPLPTALAASPNSVPPGSSPSAVTLVFTQHAATAQGGTLRPDCSYDLEWTLNMTVVQGGVPAPGSAGSVSLLSNPTHDDPHFQGTAQVHATTPCDGLPRPQYTADGFKTVCGGSATVQVTWDLQPILPLPPQPLRVDL
jgi:hypothetical protein